MRIELLQYWIVHADRPSRCCPSSSPGRMGLSAAGRPAGSGQPGQAARRAVADCPALALLFTAAP